MKGRDDPSFSRSFRHWLALQESVLNRVADYFENVGELTAENSLEPKRWVDGYAQLWSGLIGDVGDWLEREADTSLRPTAEWIARARASISRGQRTASVGFEVPLEAFGQDDNGVKEITLVSDGFSRGGDQVAIALNDRFRFVPEQVTRDQRWSELKFFNLPSLQKGIYSGMVCAEETDLPVALVELQVV